MPFGLTTAPQVLTKLLVALVAHLHLQGVTLFPYLDDVLITAPLREQSLQHTHSTLLCLKEHGFVVNQNRSSLVPTQDLIHLGLQLDTESFQIFLSPDRQRTLAQALPQTLDHQEVPLMELARLLGLMVSCEDIVPSSRFQLHPLQQFILPFAKLIQQKAHLCLSLMGSPAVRSGLTWWVAPNRLTQRLSLELPHRWILTTDASLIGWGAHLGEE